MKNKLLALLLISAFSAGASAATVTVDAGNYSLSYDQDFWGTDFSLSGDRFTFSNLANNLASSVTVNSTDPYISKYNSFSAKNTLGPTITVTADAGYTIKSILSGGAGSIMAVASRNTAVNKQGAAAQAFVDFFALWQHDNGTSLSTEATHGGGFYYEESVGPSGALGRAGNRGNFNWSMSTNVSKVLPSLTGQLTTTGWARASGEGSSAYAYLDSAYFSIGVAPIAPIPEPETWALFMAGLGVLGVVARRRKST